MLNRTTDRIARRRAARLKRLNPPKDCLLRLPYMQNPFERDWANQSNMQGMQNLSDLESNRNYQNGWAWWHDIDPLSPAEQPSPPKPVHD